MLNSNFSAAGSAMAPVEVDEGGSFGGGQSDAPMDLSIDYCDLQQAGVPEPEWVMKPFLVKGGETLLYADTGVGKSWFGWAMAAHISAGRSWGPFEPTAKRKVFLIDGEMGVGDINKRLGQITMGWTEETRGHLRVYSADLPLAGVGDPLADNSVNLSSDEGWAKIKRPVDWADVIIIDNLITLNHGTGSKNDSMALETFKNHVRRLRAAGKTILTVHHENKSGGFLGTNTIAVDVVEKIRVTATDPDAEWDAPGGNATSKVTVHLEKGRHLQPGEKRPFTVEWTSTSHNGTGWEFGGEVKDLVTKGWEALDANPSLSVRGLAVEIGCSTGRAQSIKKAWKTKNGF